ncbi:MAG: phosphate acetyltransferase [Gammaproteobacteria bacterium]|jgi:phosphate acetyltransferase
MARVLMIVPANININMAEVAESFVKIIQEEEIPVESFLPVQQDDNVSSGEVVVSAKRMFDLLSQGDVNTLLDDVVACYRLHADIANLVVVQGLTLKNDQPYLDQVNIDLASALDARVIIVAQADGKTAKYLQQQIEIIAHPYGKRLLGCVIINCNKKISAWNNKVKLLGCVKNMAEIPKKVNRDWIKILMYYDYKHNTSPSVFCYRLIEQARAANKKIILPEAEDIRIVAAAMVAANEKLARCVLVGDKHKIKQKLEQVAADKKLQISDAIEIIEPSEKLAEKYIEPMVALRKHKGLTEAVAKVKLQDPVILATMMVQQGDADGLVSGAIHTTADTVRPALRYIGTAPNTKLVSSVFFMCLPDQVLVFGDCAVNPNPSAENLSEIAIQSADSAAKFGFVPKVAMISYSTIDSGFGPDVDRVREAVKIVKEKRPDIEIDGPLQYDAAISEEVGKRKAPKSTVAGNANVFIFADLDTGNAVSKAVQRAANIVAIGPMLQGLNKPVNDLSRGATVTDIVFTIVLTAVQAI